MNDFPESLIKNKGGE